MMMVSSLTACGSRAAGTVQQAKAAAVRAEAPAKEQAEAAGQEQKPETITVTSINANNERIEVEVPYDPQRIEVIDMACLDIIDALGLGDRVVGTAASQIEYLQDYMDNETIANLGTLKSPDAEAVMECEPDIIFMGGRASEYMDTLNEIAPVIRMITDTEAGVVASVSANAGAIASVFGLEDKIAAMMEEYDSRIAALQDFAKGKNAIVGMCTSGSYNVLGNDGRCSIIGREIGFENIGVDANIDTTTHGNEAYKNGNLIYLAHPAVWYTAEGGIQALDVMLQDLKAELLNR